MRTPFISKVTIKNFRNFIFAEVDLSHKQVIIGENNVGKTNFLRALQLILDPRLNDEDRNLQETDFHESLESPMENGEEIIISIEIQGYEHNRNILAALSDATVSTNPETLRLTYKYAPIPRDDGKKVYEYKIFKGIDEDKIFTHQHRKYLNLKVISALRDVESEIRNSRKSPVNHLLRQYDIDKAELEAISERLKIHNDLVLLLDEVADLESRINCRFEEMSGDDHIPSVRFQTVDVNTQRLLNTLRLMLGKDENLLRPISESSLGLNNILFMTLMLLQLEDKTIPRFLSQEVYNELLQKEHGSIVSACYEENEKGKYKLKSNLSEQHLNSLYYFMDMHNPSLVGFTILAVEEPEAHLHPTLQRIIYKDVMKGDTSVLLTTHSTHITSVAPIDSIVHLLKTDSGTKIKATSRLEIPLDEKRDLERFIDVKRGEIYFGQGVILVEGISEEYLIPKFAELLDISLDSLGIIVCNIDSTNFKPYIKFLDVLGIPYIVLTDGDYYHTHTQNGEKIFHQLRHESHDEFGYLGQEIALDTLVELEKIAKRDIPLEINNKKELLKRHGYYLGDYTLEIEIMISSQNSEDAQTTLCNIFNALTTGGALQQKNFKEELELRQYWKCLNKIKNNGIGKGRFAQRLSNVCKREHIPEYIKNALEDLIMKVRGDSL